MAQLVAHRGQSADMPENTLLSIGRAIDCGATAVEFDLQMTADRVPVLSHDSTLQRVAGFDIDIGQNELNALLRYGVGESARLGNVFAELRLTSLREVVALLLGSPHVTAFVELKKESLERFGTALFAQQLAQGLLPIAAQCVVIADSLDVLLVMRDELMLPVGWIVRRWEEGDRRLAHEYGLEYLIINHKYIPKQQHDFAADPWQWVAYETSEKQLAESLFARGIAFVESNDICAMLRHS